MVFDFIVQASPTQIRMNVPQANLSWDIANVVAYHVFKSREMILTLGEFAEDIEKRTTAEGHLESWEKAKSDVRFVAPLAADTFHPEFAAQFLWFHLSKTRRAMRRGILGLFDKFRLHLQIADFEKVPAGKRKDFAHLLYKQLQPQSLTINDAVFDPRPYKIAEISLSLFKLVAMLCALTILAACYRSTEEITELWGIVALWVTCFSIALWLINQSLRLWIIIMRKFLPGHAMLKLLPELGLSRRTHEKFEMMLQEKESEGMDTNDN